MNYKMMPLLKEDIREYKNIMQESFQKGYEYEFGKFSKKVLPEQDIDESIYADGAVCYKVVKDGKIIGGAVVNINEKTHCNHLDLLFVKVGIQSKGVGTYIWSQIERLYPDTKVWETFTPYYEKRNVHFYVNKCGFNIVEFFNPKHLAEWNRQDKETGNMPNDVGQYFFRFEKVIKK